jgi:hypothetical protein
MSVNAHRIIDLKLETSSFDLWHDEKLTQFLEEEVRLSSNLNSYGTGLLEVPVETLERAVKMADELDLDEDTVGGLRLDIAAAKSTRNEIVTYYCC